MSIVPQRDSMAKTVIKTGNGPLALPTNQAAMTFIPTSDVVRTFNANTSGNFGTYSEFVLDASMLPDIVDKLTLSLSLSAGSATAATYVGLSGDAKWLCRLIEVSLGGVLVSSLYPENAYIREVRTVCRRLIPKWWAFL